MKPRVFNDYTNGSNYPEADQANNFSKINAKDRTSQDDCSCVCAWEGCGGGGYFESY